MVDLNQLRTFYHLVQARSYSRCAQRLFVTQSAVSHAIRKLESGLGKKLIARSGSEFVLSKEGLLLAEACDRIFSEVEAIRTKIDRLNNRDCTITLGAVVEFGTTVLMKNMTGFMERNPGIEMTYCLTSTPLKLLLEDRADLIVDCRDHSEPGLAKIRLFREDYVLVASPNYVSAKHVETLSDLNRCNLLSLDREQIWWNSFFHTLPVDRDIRPAGVTVITHLRGIINAAAAGMGVGLVPRYTVTDELASRALVSLFPDIDLLEDTFYIYIRKINTAVPRFRELIRHMRTLTPP